MNDTLVGVVVHDKVIEYWKDFEESINNQSTREFDCFVVMEDIKEISPKIECNKLEIKKVTKDTTPIINRNLIIDYAIKNQYENIIFFDADDYMYQNKIEEIIKGLKDSEMYVHNMRVVDQNRNIISDKFITSTKMNNTYLNYEMIARKNFIGLGNTGFKTNALLDALPIPETIIALDWWIASCILLAGRHAIFNECVLTDYRQYDDNIGVLTNNNIRKIEQEIIIKCVHYEALLRKMNKHCMYYDDLGIALNKSRKLQEIMNENNMSWDIYLSTIKTEEPLLWWELSELLEDKLWEQ